MITIICLLILYRTFQLIPCHPLLLMNALKTIDITKACGADNIPGRILRECAEQIVFPITMLFNKSLKASIFNSCLKRANVIPVFKSGKRDDVHIHRPKSLLSLLEKIFEKLVYDNVHTHNILK